MEITGSIKLINPAQEITATFKKRELVITTEEQYPQHIMVEFIQDKTSLLDSYNVGDKVTVSINLRGREWTSPKGEVKYFNTIQGWRIEKAGTQAGAAAATPVPEMPPLPEDDDDDLPF